MSNGYNILHNTGTDAMYFINIIEVPVFKPALADPNWYPRTSSLAVSKNHPGALGVLGELPHNYMWKPKSGLDRDKLVSFLEKLDYTK